MSILRIIEGSLRGQVERFVETLKRALLRLNWEGPAEEALQLFLLA